MLMSKKVPVKAINKTKPLILSRQTTYQSQHVFHNENRKHLNRTPKRPNLTKKNNDVNQP